MNLRPPTLALLAYLRAHPELRQQIRAPRGQTLLYAGAFFKPMWKEIDDWKRRLPQLAAKQTLPDVLARVPVPGTGFANLKAYVQDVERAVPWQPDGFIVWRALSGIFASNAAGAVSFQVGHGITAADKVFAATEVAVLARNPHVDATTKDLLAYYGRCIRSGQTEIGTGFIAQ